MLPAFLSKFFSDSSMAAVASLTDGHIMLDLSRLSVFAVIVAFIVLKFIHIGFSFEQQLVGLLGTN